MINNKGLKNKDLIITLLICALGYFVDLYDLILFNAVRISSLKDIGLTGDDLFKTGIAIINCQMAGLIAGGLFFGLLADKFGRTRLMIVSISMYSLGTALCALVPNVEAYLALRFLVGFGLAGEVGLAVTLASELVPKAYRGYAVSCVAGLGLLGAITAALLAQIVSWRFCYLIGGVLGFALLLFRLRIQESALFLKLPEEISRGSLKQLFCRAPAFKRLALCCLAGWPIPYVLWLMASFAPEITQSLGLQPGLPAAQAVLFVYIGFTIGDFLSGSFSQWIASRKKTIALFLVLQMVFCGAFFSGFLHSAASFSLFYILMGAAAGYWIVICMTAAEIFGTNLRATVASAVPNFIRAGFIPMSLAVSFLKPHIGLTAAAIWVGICVFALAIISLKALSETAHLDLEYEEPPV